MHLCKKSVRLDSKRGCRAWPFHDAHVCDLAFIQDKLEHRAHVVEPRLSNGSGIQVKATPRRDLLDEKDVAVAADEEVGTFGSQLGKDAPGVLGRAPTDVRHPNPSAFDVETSMFRPHHSNLLAVDVAIYSATVRHVLEGLGYRQRADVTGMPHFIRAFDVPEDLVVDVSVCVRQKGNLHSHKRVCPREVQSRLK